MNIKAWPFLVSRNRVFDYRSVVVPQPLFDKNASALLAEAAGGSLSGPDAATYRQIRSRLIGDMSLVYRVVRAEKRHVGLGGNEPLRDDVGRTISLIEGVALEGLIRDIVITKEDLQNAHKAIESDYREFWQDTKSTPIVKPSHYFYLSGLSSTNERLTLNEIPPLDMRVYETDDNNHFSLLELIYKLLQRLFGKS